MRAKILTFMVLGLHLGMVKAQCAGFDINDTARKVKEKIECWQTRLATAESELQQLRKTPPVVIAVPLANPSGLSAIECQSRAIETLTGLGYRILKVVGSAQEGQWVILFLKGNVGANVTCPKPGHSPVLGVAGGAEVIDELNALAAQARDMLLRR